ncbi:MAG: hypothetical protein ACRDFQ_07395 [Anaerolineales bacterium]
MATLPLPRHLLFLSFLVLGGISGFFAGSLGKASASIGSQRKSAQENSLIVYVDDLSSEQYTIKGIWLAASQEGSAGVSWMPVYPSPLSAKSDFSNPHSPLILETVHIEDLKYLAPLRHQSIWWNNIILVDNAAISVLQTLSGKSPTIFAKPWDEPQRALQEQVEFIQMMCGNSNAWGNQIALDQLLALIPAHFNTSLNPFEVITRWDTWSQTGFALNCAHPWAD